MSHAIYPLSYLSLAFQAKLMLHNSMKAGLKTEGFESAIVGRSRIALAAVNLAGQFNFAHSKSDFSEVIILIQFTVL